VRRYIAFADDMPLTQAEKKWLAEEIREAVRKGITEHVGISHKTSPSALRRLVAWAKEWGVLGAAATFIMGIVGASIVVLLFALTEWNRVTEFRIRTEDKLGNIGTKLQKLETDLVSLRAFISASQPGIAQNQKAAKELLAQAKQKLIPPIPESAVEQAGKNFIEASKSEPKAWGIALEFLSYRSSLNMVYRPAGSIVPLTPGATWKYHLPSVQGRPMYTFAHTSRAGVPHNEAARCDRIGVDQNVDTPTGAAWLFIVGGAARIDGEQIRNAAFTGVEVHYSGGPLILENVMFIDCTFVFENVEPAHQLAESILASAKVDFRNAA